jgi:hypothetical protein
VHGYSYEASIALDYGIKEKRDNDVQLSSTVKVYHKPITGKNSMKTSPISMMPAAPFWPPVSS